jgi:hypothetical protein
MSSWLLKTFAKVDKLYERTFQKTIDRFRGIRGLKNSGREQNENE